MNIIVIAIAMSAIIANAEMNKADIPEISAKIAYKEFKNNKAVIIDSMPPEDYVGKGHMVGAINIPNNGPGDLDNLRSMNLSLEKNQVIYVYCG